jgi:hypothetical protein
MEAFHLKYIKDSSGNNLVGLSQIKLDCIIEEIEDIEDVELFDLAQSNDDGERYTMKETFQLIETN